MYELIYLVVGALIFMFGFNIGKQVNVKVDKPKKFKRMPFRKEKEEVKQDDNEEKKYICYQ
jgi:hypothetical protein